MREAPVLCVVVPCYNEASVLPLTAPVFADHVRALVEDGMVDPASHVTFVDDGSRDATWEIICDLAAEDPSMFHGIALSRNRGHQNALLCGLMEVRTSCDVTVSMDADGQDDPGAMAQMVIKYREGCDVVYGVRSNRDTDSAFKRGSARAFYRLMGAMGVESVYDHADYRLMSRRALDGLAQFGEVNLFLRGMVPLVGYKSGIVHYERHSRVAGASHYPLSKMVALALNGITSLSVKPIRLITAMGVVVSLVGFVGVVWALVTAIQGHAIAGWTSTVAIICFMGGVQLLSLGVIGEYVGKIYLESKHRPRYIVGERTPNEPAHRRDTPAEKN
ncbi:MAG: glycosyltransferase family 2 protein [Atopobiaceae bacterium]|nr:glycosyltransferase family 2 protein [Atopobiaceae bacterium]